MTPGRYLRLRRKAAGLKIDELPVDGLAVLAIERDIRAPTNIELWALRCAMQIDVEALVAIGRGVIPQVCRQCGCTEHCACDTGHGIGCHWVEPDLCSACESSPARLELAK